MKIQNVFLLYIFSLACFGYGYAIHSVNPCTIETLYGSAVIDEPVLIELINSSAMQRLKKINQYGILPLIRPGNNYTRYQHSIGVLFLMRHYGASLEEQVVGLLHDVSHTVFSHVADYIFGTVRSKESYQDQIFEEFVSNTDILPILKKHNLDWICPPSVRYQYTMLKDDLPNLCADRLEYNLYGGYLEGWLNQEQIMGILEHLHYHKGQWIFDTMDSARTFALVSLYLSKNIWCAAWNGFLNTQMANLLKRGIALELITMDDVTYSIDENIWHILTTSTDSELQMLIERIENYENHFAMGTPENHDLYIKGKLRTVDPLVTISDGIAPLSEIDGLFKMIYEQTKAELAPGWYIRYS